VVEQRVDDLAHVVDPLAVGRDQIAQPDRIVVAVVDAGCTTEIRQIFLCCGHGGRLVRDADVDHAVSVLDVDRTDVFRVIDAEAAALDHRRAAHPDARVLGGDHYVAAPEQGSVAGEAIAGRDANQRDDAAEPREQMERPHVEAGYVRPVDVARTPATALGEQHDRELSAFGDLEKPILLEVVAHPLGAGQHRVVV
jgi:hypothetical protein